MRRSSRCCASSPAAWRSGTPTNGDRSVRARRCSTVRSSRRFGTGSSTRPPTGSRSTTKTCSRSARGRCDKRRRSRRRGCSGGRRISPSVIRAWRPPRRPAPRPSCWTRPTSSCPDVLTELQDRTQLTRRSVQRVLSASGRLDDFRRNPQQFIELAGQAINGCKRQALVDGIKYQRLGDEHYYAQELFETKELTGYLKNMLAARKSVHESVVYELDVEARFADQLEKNDAVRVYAKLPGWFQVKTPLGSYNPGLGRPGRFRRRGTALLRGGDQGQPVSPRSSHRRECQDCVWTSTLQCPCGARAAGSVRGDERS